MPRILRIINRLNLGGPTFNVSYLSRYLAPEYETLLVSGQKDDSEESSEFIPRELGLEPVFVPEMRREINFKQDRLAYLKIKDIIKEFKPDIVHTHAAKAGAIGRLAAHHCKVPVILHTFHGHVFHSYFSAAKTRLYIEIEKYLATKSTCIVAISDLQKDALVHQFKICRPEKVAVVKLGFDLAKFQDNQILKRKEFRHRYHLDEDEIAIGIIGRLVPVKNHVFFLQGLKEVLKETRQKVRAFIVGDGELRHEIERYAITLGIDFTDTRTDHRKTPLSFTSWIKDIDFVYAGLDIVALTSLNEGTPVSLIEAQAASKPIVTTNVGGIEDIVLPGITALLSEAGDLKAFVHNLLQVIDNPEIRRGLSEKGRQHVDQAFHYSRLVEDTRKLYDRLLLEAL